MEELESIRQGEHLPFSFDRSGESIEGWTCTIHVQQSVGGASFITRVIVPDNSDIWSGFLTQSETATLSSGLYYLIGKLFNASTDQEAQIPLRFDVKKAWF